MGLARAITHPQRRAVTLRSTGTLKGVASLCYVGRRRDADVSAGSIVLGDRDVLPVRLGPLLDQAACLTILDPMSFPFDALRAVDRDIPIALELPGGWDAETLVQLLGMPVLRDLSPFDLVCAEDDETWEALRARHSWPAGIRASQAALRTSVGDLAGDPPGSARRRKSVFRVLSKALRPQLDTAHRAIPPGERFAAMILADEVDNWASLLPLAGADVIGFALEPGSAERAARNFPEWCFGAQPPGGGDESETVHGAVCIAALCDRGPEERDRRLAGLLRAVRVGGRLVVLDRFFDGFGGRANGGPSPRRLLAEIADASQRNVVLEHVEAIRLPGDDLSSVGLFAFTKLGRPQRL
jgi:hypothetical protein